MQDDLMENLFYAKENINFLIDKNIFVPLMHALNFPARVGVIPYSLGVCDSDSSQESVQKKSRNSGWVSKLMSFFYVYGKVGQPDKAVKLVILSGFI